MNSPRLSRRRQRSPASKRQCSHVQPKVWRDFPASTRNNPLCRSKSMENSFVIVFKWDGCEAFDFVMLIFTRDSRECSELSILDSWHKSNWRYLGWIKIVRTECHAESNKFHSSTSSTSSPLNSSWALSEQLHTEQLHTVKRTLSSHLFSYFSSKSRAQWESEKWKLCKIEKLDGLKLSQSHQCLLRECDKGRRWIGVVW